MAEERLPAMVAGPCLWATTPRFTMCSLATLVARAVLRVDLRCVRQVLVYRQACCCGHGIATALYGLIEADLGRPLVPSRIRSRAGLAFLGQPRASSMRLPH